jgi:hypothetical protein
MDTLEISKLPSFNDITQSQDEIRLAASPLDVNIDGQNMTQVLKTTF